VKAESKSRKCEHEFYYDRRNAEHYCHRCRLVITSDKIRSARVPGPYTFAIILEGGAS
jgi:hypothetical protein